MVLHKAQLQVGEHRSDAVSAAPDAGEHSLSNYASPYISRSRGDKSREWSAAESWEHTLQ